MEDILIGEIGRSTTSIRREWQQVRDELSDYQAHLIHLKNTVKRSRADQVELSSIKGELASYREHYPEVITYLQVPQEYRFDDSHLSSFYKNARMRTKHGFQVDQAVSYLRDLITELNSVGPQVDQQYRMELNEYAQSRVRMGLLWTMIVLLGTIMARIVSSGDKTIGSGPTALFIIAIGLVVTSIIIDTFAFHGFHDLTSGSLIRITHLMSIVSFFGLVFSFLSYIVSVGLV